MSDQSPSKRHFVSWVRRGIGASINSAPAAGQTRVNVGIQLSIVNQSGAAYPTQPTAVQVELYGPGDVIGIDPRHIVRTEPLKDTVNFEPNYLCAIEFDSPDFPWIFTPTGVGGNPAVSSGSGCPGGDRLAPWVALIALKPGEYSAKSGPPNPLPAISVTTDAPLQSLSDAWNWAHAQVNGNAGLAATLTTAPGNVFSRLLCPRRLDPESSYSAFLVPAYEIGRLAGLGQSISGTDPSSPAWGAATKYPLDLPVYYQFNFHTSDEGDFESLVRRLTPNKNLSGAVGQRPMDVSSPGMALPAVASKPMGLEGALGSSSLTSSAWDNNEKNTFQSSLQSLINQTSPVKDDPSNPNPKDPVIVPPIYGRWPAGVASVTQGSGTWVTDLNLDPRTRVAAGMGTQVIQNERTQLLASAWQQLEGVLEANQKIQQGQLALATLQQLYDNKFRAATTSTVLNLTAPLLGRVLDDSKTVRATVRGSLVPERALSAAYRRATRARIRRVSPVAPRRALLEKINDGTVDIVPPLAPPQGMVSLEEISDTPAESLDQKLHQLLNTIKKERHTSTGFFRRFLLMVAAMAVRLAIFAVELWEKLSGAVAGQAPAEAIRMSNFTPAQVAAMPPRPQFTLTAPNSAAAATGTTENGQDSAQAKAFREATSGLFDAFQSVPGDSPDRPSLALPVLQQTVLKRIDPGVTVSQRIRAMISLPRLSWQPSDILASPILAAPEFPQPMYLPLRDLSPSYLLPGADEVPQDSISLVVQNHKFIESYMAGLSHEMTRQLIWENYPTFDQRATYFRQFWDVSAYVPQPGDPADATALSEMLKDIPLIPLWKQPLGKNLNRPDVPAKNVVLLIRGEILRRYPNTIIYAVKAKRDANNKRVRDDTDQRYPIYRGTLPDDMTFLGFNLSVDDARGGTKTSPDGFFFVFQQPPAEPRFGLELTEVRQPTVRWAELAWSNFASTTTTVTRKAPSSAAAQAPNGKSPWRRASQLFSTVLKTTQLPAFLSGAVQPSDLGTLNDIDDQNNKWGQNSAQTAYILLRMPFRILMHATLLLP